MCGCRRCGGDEDVLRRLARKYSAEDTQCFLVPQLEHGMHAASSGGSARWIYSFRRDALLIGSTSVRDIDRMSCLIDERQLALPWRAERRTDRDVDRYNCTERA